MRRSGEEVSAKRFRVEGRVQGVGFRWWTKKLAAEHGLVGWVRNRGDGSVEVKARGHPEAVAGFRDALREGPPAARVEAVYEEDLGDGNREHAAEWADFSIERG